MKILRLRDGKWVWAIRSIGKIGQAYGEADSREKAVKYAMERMSALWPVRML